MKLFFALMSILMLAACAHAGPSLSAAQLLEKADSEALSAYTLTIIGINAAEKAAPSATPTAEKLRASAVTAIKAEQAAYIKGQAVDAFVTQLQGMQNAATAMIPTAP